MSIIAIDPSINNVGFACFIKQKLYRYKTINAPAGTKVPQRLNGLGDQLKEEILLCQKEAAITSGIIEIAESFSYSRSSNVNQKSLHLLQLATGALIRTCGELGINLASVSPYEWKGHTSKKITLQYVNLEFNLKLKMKDNNASDAIALGQWYLRRKNLIDKRS